MQNTKHRGDKFHHEKNNHDNMLYCDSDCSHIREYSNRGRRKPG